MKNLYPLCILISLLFVSGCGATATTPNGTSSNPQESPVRQTDDNGVSLPFANSMPERWNRSNDGTPYEPCTAVTPEIAESQGLDPKSVADAATVNGQTLRGCDWQYLDPSMLDWSAHQIVGDFSSLQSYRSRNEFFNWLPDRELSGRQVGVASLNSGDCFTYVQSRESGVVTGVSFASLPRPQLSEICDRAMALTRATIDSIPE
ncbi:DUF3558 family protein [Gordonia prachuapensis]|uniref:DUF3558 family protein n=1 Tax=Gordonia prachuapensis TaxID=3115651 RepID=UPI003D67A373